MNSLMRSGGAAVLSVLAGACAGSPERARPVDPLAQREVQVGFVLLDGVYNSELVAPFDVFHHVASHAKPGMKVFTVGRERGVVTSFEGLRIGCDYAFEQAPEIDVMVVPSGEHSMKQDVEDRRLIGWLAERGKRARYVVSVCDGTFPLAEAGLLDGRTCTTFPGDIGALRERYPKLHVVDGPVFVRDGPVVTGVGGARSYEPAMFLVEELYGTGVARRVGRGLVLDWDRSGVLHIDRR